MKLSVVMGLICLGLTAVVLAMFLIEERPAVETIDAAGNVTTVYAGHGQAHPEYDTLLVGGSGAERGERIWWLGFAFGLLELALFVTCMLLGVRRNGVIGPAGRFIAACAFVYLLAFVALMFSYRGYMTADALTTFGSFPAPTAWMVYAVGLVPLVFLLVFVLGFRDFIWDDESERKLAQIVEEIRASGERA